MISTKMPPELFLLSQHSLDKLLVVRSGHGDLVEYHRRSHYFGADLSCDCGANKAPDHPFHYEDRDAMNQDQDALEKEV